MKDSEPRYQRNLCPHCGNVTAMEIVQTYNDSRSIQGDDYHYEEADAYDILKCPACKEIIFRNYYWNDGMDLSEVQYHILYPSTRRVPDGLPGKILSAFNAAEKVRKIDPNSYGVLLRRLIELVCIDRNCSRSTLHESLLELAKKKEIPEKLVEIARHLKDLGNVGAHATLGELTSEEVPILENLGRAILEYVYSAPHLAKKAEESLKKFKI